MDVQSLLDDLIQVLRSPAEEPVRTALVAALLFFAFVVVALLVLILLPSKRDERADGLVDDSTVEGGGAAEEPLPPKGDPRREAYVTWGYRLVTAGILLALLGGALFADAAVQRTSFCLARCHVLEDAVASWQTGPHREVDCIDCHRTPGLFGRLDTRIRAARDAWANLQGAETVVSAAVVDQQACRRCHADGVEGVLESGGLRVRHRDFETVLACGSCHAGMGHQATGLVIPAPESVMSLCARCHLGEGAPSDCRTCHVADLLVAGDDDPGLGKIDLPAPEDCGGCHDLAPCTACHGILMPHPADWGDPKAHAPRGAFGLDPVCSRCHEPGCPECHSRLRTNHGADWRTEHQDIVGGEGCVLRCHDKSLIGDDMCRLCH